MPADEENSPAVAAEHAAFPPSLPRSLSDHASISENDWAAFESVSEMINHWTRSPWPQKRTVLYWYLTFDNAELTTLATQCQKEIRCDGIDFTPPNGLHITMLKIGNSDTVSPETVSEIVNRFSSNAANIGAFELAIGPLTGSRGALRFSVAPWTELFLLHDLMRDALISTMPRLNPVTTDRFRPHLGIGYSNRRQPANKIIADVRRVRDISPIKIPVTNAKLVELRRDGKTYRWNDVATVKFNAAE